MAIQVDLPQYRGPGMGVLPSVHASAESFGAGSARDMARLSNALGSFGSMIMSEEQAAAKKCDNAFVQSSMNSLSEQWAEKSKDLFAKRGSDTANIIDEGMTLFDSMVAECGTSCTIGTGGKSLSGGNIERQEQYSQRYTAMRERAYKSLAAHRNKELKQFEQDALIGSLDAMRTEMNQIASFNPAYVNMQEGEEVDPEANVIEPVNPGEQLAIRLNAFDDKIAEIHAGRHPSFIKKMQDKAFMENISSIMTNFSDNKTALDFFSQDVVKERLIGAGYDYAKAFKSLENNVKLENITADATEMARTLSPVELQTELINKYGDSMDDYNLASNIATKVLKQENFKREAVKAQAINQGLIELQKNNYTEIPAFIREDPELSTEFYKLMASNIVNDIDRYSKMLPNPRMQDLQKMMVEADTPEEILALRRTITGQFSSYLAAGNDPSIAEAIITGSGGRLGTGFNFDDSHNDKIFESIITAYNGREYDAINQDDYTLMANLRDVIEKSQNNPGFKISSQDEYTNFVKEACYNYIRGIREGKAVLKEVAPTPEELTAEITSNATVNKKTRVDPVSGNTITSFRDESGWHDLIKGNNRNFKRNNREPDESYTNPESGDTVTIHGVDVVPGNSITITGDAEGRNTIVLYDSDMNEVGTRYTASNNAFAPDPYGIIYNEPTKTATMNAFAEENGGEWVFDRANNYFTITFDKPVKGEGLAKFRQYIATADGEIIPNKRFIPDSN